MRDFQCIRSVYTRANLILPTLLLVLSSACEDDPAPQVTLDASTDVYIDGGAIPDAPSADVTANDLAPGDTLRADERVPDAMPPDAMPPDAMLPDAMLPDAMPPDAGCVEPPSVNSGVACAQQCVSSTGDTDCDGLPTGQDIDSACNQLLFVDDFSTAPDPAIWNSNTAHPWTCGNVELEPTATVSKPSLTLADASLLGTGGTRYLVEMRFQLVDAVLDGSETWKVGIRSGLDTKGLQCELWMHKTYQAIAPGLHVNSLASCGTMSGNWGGLASGVGIGKWFYLQVWNDGSKSRCRILDENWNNLDSNALYNCPATTPDRFHIYAQNATVQVDYVRVFEAN
jgi:hypothetical protein